MEVGIKIKSKETSSLLALQLDHLEILSYICM